MKHKNIFFHYYKTQSAFDAIQETDLEGTVSFVEENRRLYLSKTQYCTLSLEDRRRLDMIDQLPTKEELEELNKKLTDIENHLLIDNVHFTNKLGGEGKVVTETYPNPAIVLSPIDDSTKNLAGYNEVIIKGCDASAIEVTDTTKCTKSVVGNDVKLTFKLDSLSYYTPDTKLVNNTIFHIYGFDVDVIVPANPYGEASKVKEFNMPTVKEVLDAGEKAPTSNDELDVWYKNEFVLSYGVQKSIQIEQEVAPLIQISKAANASLSGTTLTLTPSKKVDANDVFSIGHVHFALEGMYPTIRVTSSGERLEDYESTTVSHDYMGDDADIVQVGSMVTSVTNVLRKDATEIPKDIFKYAMNVTNFSAAFYGCSSLTDIPSGLFDSCVNVISFGGAFQYCGGLTSIPNGLFDSCVNVVNFEETFVSCSELTSIPSGLFDKNVNVVRFNRTFQYCGGLTSIPNGLFDSCVNVSGFEYTFQNCRGLTSIPSGLFDKNVNVVSFAYAFKGCSGLTEIPAGLFDKNVNVVSFYETFSVCSGLTSIPSGLFDKNVNMTIFNSTFYGCSGLTDIPSGLFDSCVNVRGFDDTFEGCSGLTSIPSGLFDSCVNVRGFYKTFKGCSGLTEIPAGLFDKNVNVTDFRYTFEGCSGLTCESPYSVAQDGSKIHLYERTNVESNSKCFYGCTKLTDWNQIPDGWK